MCRHSVFFALLLLSGTVLAQQNKYKFEHVSVEQGLSHSIVYSIVQDKKGFLWFGTQKGLNRYNGYEFDVFENDPLDSSTVSSDDVSLVYEDHEGKFWLATWGGGLNLFDPSTESFTHYRHRSDDPGSISDDFIQAIFEDKNGTMWIGTAFGGLNRFDRATGRFTAFRHRDGDPASLSHDRVWAIEEVAGSLWIGTMDGLCRLDPTTGRFQTFYVVPGRQEFLPANQIRVLFRDSKNRFWIGTQKGVGIFDLQTGTFEKVTDDPVLSSSIINCFHEDEFGGIWIGTNGFGLFELDPVTRNLKRFVHDPYNPTSIGFDDIRDIYEDRAGTLWIATRGGGVNKLNRNTEKITHFFNEVNNPNSLASNNVRSLLRDREGRLWIGTDGDGLDMWDPVTRKFRHYVSIPGSAYTLSNNYVYCLAQSVNGDIWVATRDGLNMINPRTQGITRYISDFGPAVGGSHIITAVMEDSRGMLWIGTSGNGVFEWDRKQRMLTQFKGSIPGTSVVMDEQIGALYEDRSGTVWIGSLAHGLYRVEPGRNRFVHYRHDPRVATSLSHDRIRAIYEDASGAVWVATEGGGLNLMDRTTETFTRFTEKEGLAHDVAYGILPDENGHLWISTNNGLSRFNPISRTFVNYYEDDGFQGNVYNPNAYTTDHRGTLYFGGINGLNEFRPADIRGNHHVPPIVLTAFRRFDKRVKFDKGLSLLTELNLTHRDNFFSFEFAALDYVFPGKNRYAYKLEGFDNEWIQAGTRRFASYTNLDGGHYVFRVRGSNNDLVWNDEGLALNVYIAPPIWATWWFRLTAVVAFGMIIYAGFRRRLRNMEAQRAVLEQEIRSRTRELREQKEQLETAVRYLRETQAHLIHSEKMASLGQLTAGIAHEINNPLSFIDGNLNYFEDYLRGLTDMIERSEAVITRPDDDWRSKIENLKTIRANHDYHFVRDDVAKILQSCKNGTERIKKIILDLRNFANLDDTELRFADVHEGITTTLSLLASQYNDRIEVVQEFGDLPEVLCFPGSLNQVFVNLILNAVQAIPNKGTITIRTRRIMRDGQPWVEISFTDTGVGIDPENVGKIFDPFFTTKEVGQGTGLGLTIAYGIIEKHYGNIECRSEPGRGTTFIIQLPVESPHLKGMRL